jgi:hypothetical protein
MPAGQLLFLEERPQVVRQLLKTVAAGTTLCTLCLAVSTTASADCCQGSTNLPVGFYTRFPVAMRLAPTMVGKIRSKTAGRFTAEARIDVGAATVVRTTVRGHSGKIWSILTLRFTARQRLLVRRAAHGSHQGAVMYVTVRGHLSGYRAPRFGFAHYRLSLRDPTR